MTDKKLNEVFAEYLEQAVNMMDETELGLLLPTNLSVYLYNGFRGVTIANASYYPDIELYEIKFCKKWFIKWVEESNDKEIIDTLLHEFCHTLPDGFNHKKQWKSYVGILNEKFNLNIKRFG